MADDYIQDKEDAQKAVDRLVAARTEMDAAIAGINDVRDRIKHRSTDALAFIDQYMNPNSPNPEPIAPAVAAPAPAEEPSVFTTVDNTQWILPRNAESAWQIALSNSSGGDASGDVSPTFSTVVPPVEEAPVSADAPAPQSDAPVADDSAPVASTAVPVTDEVPSNDAAASQDAPVDVQAGSDSEE